MCIKPSGTNDRDQLHLGIDLQLGVLLSGDDVDRAQRATFLALPDPIVGHCSSRLLSLVA